MTTSSVNRSPSADPRRRWYQFRLRTLLIFMALCTIPFAWVNWELEQRRREKPVVDWVEEMGGEISNVWWAAGEASWWQEQTDEWFGAPVRRIYLSGGEAVNDLSPLAGLKHLTRLRLVDTQVSNLSPLSGMKNPEDLNLDDTQVSDLSPLVGLKNLKRLWFDNTQVTDLSPLAGLKNLERLDLSETPVSKEQVQMLQKALPNCSIEHSVRRESDSKDDEGNEE